VGGGGCVGLRGCGDGGGGGRRGDVDEGDGEALSDDTGLRLSGAGWGGGWRGMAAVVVSAVWVLSAAAMSACGGGVSVTVFCVPPRRGRVF
jgi:hypothetical protein